MSGARYYSLRRLSPYQGTVQVAELPGFRAMSADGLTWQVQIQNRAAAGATGRARFSTHGTWRADGSSDLAEPERLQPFLGALRDHPRLPFPLADRLELWLLDGEWGLPLALLAATFPDTPVPRTTYARWQATLSHETGFESASLAVQQAVGGADDSGAPHGEVLARHVRAAAGAEPRAQWFDRRADGGGIGRSGAGLPAAFAGRRLSRTAFPELLVREDWDDDTLTDLVRDYHAWHAAALLTHDNLSQVTRARLEAAACRQADKLYRLRLLLPEAVDAERLKVAMVAAVIRQANAPAAI